MEERIEEMKLVKQNLAMMHKERDQETDEKIYKRKKQLFLENEVYQLNDQLKNICLDRKVQKNISLAQTQKRELFKSNKQYNGLSKKKDLIKDISEPFL